MVPFLRWPCPIRGTASVTLGCGARVLQANALGCAAQTEWGGATAGPMQVAGGLAGPARPPGWSGTRPPSPPSQTFIANCRAATQAAHPGVLSANWCLTQRVALEGRQTKSAKRAPEIRRRAIRSATHLVFRPVPAPPDTRGRRCSWSAWHRLPLWRVFVDGTSTCSRMKNLSMPRLRCCNDQTDEICACVSPNHWQTALFVP